ncbi:MAG: O-antigen ligase family protein [Oscillospiraceae bacterium]|nr:O-antigen ligase family protein [Oscillospiraceae bacterium]
MTGENKRKKKNIFKGSKILDFLFFIADWIYRKIGVSLAALIFTGYETCQKYYERSLFYRLFQGYKPSPVKNPVRKIKKSIITKCENSILITGIKNFADNILSAGLNTLGVFFISVGFYSSLVYLLKVYILKNPDTMMIDLIAGLALTAFSVLLIIFGRQSLYESLYGSSICNFIIFRFLGFPERIEKQGRQAESKNQNQNLRKVNIICFFIGMILGIMTYFTNLSDWGSVIPMCLAIVGIVAFYIILCYPEMGFLAFLFAVPFLPSGNLVITGAMPCILISGCYFLKLIRGKRTFNFEIFDLFVLMFSMLIFFSGAISVSKTGSIRPALIYLCFTLIYFTGVNIIRSKEMIKRTVAVLMFSGFLVAAYGIFQNYFGVGDQTWQDADMFSDIAGRVVSTFGNPNVLAEYLILIIPFVIVSLVHANRVRNRMPYIIYIFFTLLCLVYTWSRGSWLGIIFSSMILLIIINRKVIVAYLGILLIVPFAPIVLSETIIQRFTTIGSIADSSTSYRVSIWQAAIKLIKDYIIEGIGVGIEAFKLVYPGYSLAGIESAPHSHSLYLQVCVEYGSIGLAVFIFIIFLFMQYCFTAIKKANETYIKLFVAAGLCAVTGFLLNGFTDYVWYNYRVYLMFWLIVSITVAVCRFSLRNQTPKEEPGI